MTIARPRLARAAALVAVGTLALPVLGLAPQLTTSAVAAPTPDVRISEIESQDGEPGDWFELVNNGSEAVELSGWIVKDDKDENVWTLPEGARIEAGQHLAIDQDDTGETGFPFGLGKADQLRLFLPDGTPVDQVAWEKHAATTYIRVDGALVESAEATKGTPNAAPAPAEPAPVEPAPEDGEAPAEPTPAQRSIRINEVVSDGGSPDDWVELTNIGDEPVDISGFRLLDDDDTKEPSVIVPGTVLEPGGFLVVDRDELGFGLGKGDMVRLYTPDGVELDRAAWPADTHATPSLQRCPDGQGEFTLSRLATKGAANNCSAPVVINETSSQGEDFVELKNVSDEPVDVSGWIIRDDDDAHVHELPSGTVIAPGGLLLITGDDLGFGLGGADAVRVHDAEGNAVAEIAWTEHVSPSLGLCEDGERVPQAAATPGAPNDCATPDPAQELPGTGQVIDAEVGEEWGEDLSGLDLQTLEDGEQILWATNNDRGQISRLVRDGDTWVQSEGWPTGGVLTRFPDGTGSPDGEGISVGEDGKVYQSVERDNDQGGTSRNAVLRYDVSGPVGQELVAETEWDLTALLPKTGANAGLEAIEVVPAGAVARFGGEVPTGAEAYAFVALEATGDVYAVALMPGGDAVLIATLETPLDGVMALDYSVSRNQLWAFCDEACEGESVQFDLSAETVEAGPRLARITGMDNYANEGVAVSEWVSCQASDEQGGLPIWFADDADTDGTSLRGTKLPGVDCPVQPGSEDERDGEGAESGSDGGRDSDADGGSGDGQEPGEDAPEQEAHGRTRPDGQEDAGSGGRTEARPEDSAPSMDGHAAQQDGDLARTGVEAPAIAAAGMAAIAAGGLLLRRRTDV